MSAFPPLQTILFIGFVGQFSTTAIPYVEKQTYCGVKLRKSKNQCRKLQLMPLYS